MRRAASRSDDGVGGAPAARRAATRTSRVLSALLLTKTCAPLMMHSGFLYRADARPVKRKSAAVYEIDMAHHFLKSIAFSYATGWSRIIASQFLMSVYTRIND